MILERYLSSLNTALSEVLESVAYFDKGQWLLLFNDYLPYVGIVMVLFVLFAKRFRTDGVVFSSILHLYLMMFMMQIWADDGSLMFSPSRQSVLARLIILIIAALTVMLSCGMKKKQAHMKKQIAAQASDNRRLAVINEHLKEQIKLKSSDK